MSYGITCGGLKMISSNKEMRSEKAINLTDDKLKQILLSSAFDKLHFKDLLLIIKFKVPSLIKSQNIINHMQNN